MASISLSPLPFPTHNISFSRLRHSLTPPPLHHRRRLISAAVRQDTTVFTPTPISLIQPAAETLFHISISVSDAPDIASSYTRPGQYVKLKVPDSPKPITLAIASPPSYGASRGEFEFLVKDVTGTTAEVLCGLKRGDVVELTAAMGMGFDLDKISPPQEFPTVLIFATDSGISPIRSLIESGFDADKRSDVRLYYGARNLKSMAYQDRFKDWESSGVKIVQVLSKPDEGWSGETGYVQAAFSRSKNIKNPLTTGVVLCGNDKMTKEITAILTEDGVSSDKILKNF